MKFGIRKLKRELKRPLDQARAVVQSPFEAWTKYFHDKSFYKNIRITEGSQPASVKVAIFLIYQPKGMTATIALTCQHLASHGYAVIVTSNLMLSDRERSQLFPHVWRIIERPNVGYDFGGYRDGLRFARECLPELKAVIVMNDTIWWPVFPTDNTIERLETSGHDVMGFFRSSFRPRRGERSNRVPFIHSYFYWFGANALSSVAFWRFWERYRLSSFKYNAIRRGEMTLTGFLESSGLSMGSLFSLEAILERLSVADNRTLDLALKYFSHDQADAMEEAARIRESLHTDPNWSSVVLEFLERICYRREFQLILTQPLCALMGMNVLKKANNYPSFAPHHLTRMNFLAAVNANDIPKPTKEVLLEIEKAQLMNTVPTLK